MQVTRNYFRPDIQGLRAIAVGAVVANHAGLPFLPGGYVGVDVFFVISGFLITSLLLRELDEKGRIDFTGFYSRRARRILPASFAVLVLSVIGAVIWIPPLLRVQMLRDAIATALYVPNFALAIRGTDYLNASSAPSLFQHYWSLGVEEQFYVLWPPILAAVFFARRFRGVATLTVGVLVAVSFVVCVVETFHAQPWAFFSLWTRAWELGIGALAALVLRRWQPRQRSRSAAIASWLGLVGIVTSCVVLNEQTTFPGYLAALPVIATALAIVGGASESRWNSSFVLSRRPFQFIGAISYSLYLVHWPMLVLAQAIVGYYTPLPLWAGSLIAASAVPIAWLLYRFVEVPARHPAWLIRGRPRRSLGLAAAATATVASVAALAIVATILVPLDSGRAIAASAPTAPPITSGFVPSNLTPSLAASSTDNPAIYAQGCEVGYTPSTPHPCSTGPEHAPRIVLFGDSHAAAWYPALERIAADNGFQLVTETKSACPSVDVEISWASAPYSSCDAWRASVIHQLRDDPPAMVVMSNYTNPDFQDKSHESTQWQRGLESSLDQLKDVTQVAVIADTPDLRVSPTVCLSANLRSADACARPAAVALNTPGRVAESVAAKRAGVPLIDMTEYFCTTRQCPVISGNVLMYRDSHHITATYSARLTPALEHRLGPLLAARPGQAD
ncbi:acyltransferase [Planctomonas sp. JC2975]|uniref:acyltransferase family protein n=1 Tax=Planctomonas sp. JC2975 TaxID=2729626 RepID=UPI001474B9D0|nr:acyltransferase family protein [Planctomonas sp. JC2975]NNC11587.1 acyltransferase [Planctomonas sp. JC2975]